MNTSLLSRSTAVGLVALAFAAPVAGADDHFKDSHFTGATASGGEPLQNYRGADAQGAPTQAPEIVVVPTRRPAPAPGDPIEWTDAMIGAGGAIGVSLVLLGGTLLAVNRRRPRVTA
jgi:hypothetical protein